MIVDSLTDEGVDEVFLRAVWPGLVRLGRLLTGSQEQGEDIAQEAVLGLLRRESVLAPRAYLRRSMVNLSINHARRTSRERFYLAGIRELHVQTSDIDEIWPVVVGLPARQRAVVVLRYYEDLSEADIAAVLGCRPGTVKSLAARALKRLRQELEP
jgi:RNA polymerase sigma factor (sigma-70 family)